MASSPSFSSAFAMDVVAPHNDNTDQIATTPTSLGKMLTPTRAATMTTMTAATSIIDEYNAQSAMKRGLASSALSLEENNSAAGSSFDFHGRRKMSRVAVWTGTPWGSNRQAVTVGKSTPPPTSPSPSPTATTTSSLSTPLSLLIPSLRQAPTPPQQQSLAVSNACVASTASRDQSAVRRSDYRSSLASKKLREIQERWAEAEAAESAAHGQAGGGSTGRVFGGGGAVRPEDPSGGEATAPNWATGGGGGSMGGFGGDSALSRPDRCANGAMDVVVDNNGDDGAAFTARRVCHRAEELPSRGTGRELGGEHSGGGSAGDEAGGGNVGGEDGWGSGGHSVAAVGWAAVGSAADVSARGTSFAGSDMETQRI